MCYFLGPPIVLAQCEILFPDIASVRDANSALPSHARYTKCIWPWFVAEVMEASLMDDYLGNREHEFNAAPRRCTAGMLRKQSVLIRSMYVSCLCLPT